MAIVIATTAMLTPTSAGAQAAARRDMYNASVSMSEAYDRVPADAASFFPANGEQSVGLSTMLSGTGEFARNRRTLSLVGNGEVSFRQTPGERRFESLSHNVSFGENIRLSNRNHLQFTERATYSPLFLYQLLPTSSALESGEIVAVDPGYRSRRSPSYTYGGRATYEYGATRGTQITSFADFDYTDSRRQADNRGDLSMQTYSGEVSHPLSRTFSVLAGYEYRATDYGWSGTAGEHRVPIGAEFSPALSRSRRAQFTVRVSPTVVEQQGTFGESEQRIDKTSHLTQWEGTVGYPFLPKWRAQARTCWCVEYLPDVGEALLSKGVWLDLTGLVGRRVDVSGSGGYASGTSIAGTPQRLATYTGSARFSYALGRTFSVHTEYVYYQYDSRYLLGFDPAFPSALNVHSVRVGFTLLARPPRQ